jgi:CRISPR-associated protein Cas1
MQIVLNGFGEYLGERNTEILTISENHEVKKEIPIYEVEELYLMDGNSVSTSALSLCALYDVPVMLLSHTGKILSMNLPFNINGECRVKTRIAQYESRNSTKGCEIAKGILLSKINNQKQLLLKYNQFLSTEKIETRINKIKEQPLTPELRNELNSLEGKASEQYFKTYFNIIPSTFRPDKRESYKAQSKFNNLLNLGYEILSAEIYKSVLLSHLDPYLGYLHGEQYLKPSLICDLIEPFRYNVDEFLITYILKIDPKDSFEMEGKKPYLTSMEMKNYILELSKTFDNTLEHQRIKKFGKRAKLRTLIKEEPIRLAQYLRDEKTEYIPFRLNNLG